MSAEFWITTLAIVMGPICAVLIAQYFQNRKEKRERKLNVYRSLMAARKTALSPQRVEALNLVDVEFAGSSQVLAALNELMQVYNSESRWKSADQSVRLKAIQDAEDKTADLLQAMGKELGFSFEALQLLRSGYRPEAFNIIEGQQHDAREFLASLNRGTRALPIIVVPPKVPEESSE
ncbi:DUF6680 family protein [Roseivivax sp.]